MSVTIAEIPQENCPTCSDVSDTIYVDLSSSCDGFIELKQNGDWVGLTPNQLRQLVDALTIELSRR